MNMKRVLAIGIAGLTVVPVASSYELTTHAAMTYNAFGKSKLSLDRAVARDLGIEWFLVDPGPDYNNWNASFKSTNPFGKKYFDTNSMSGGSDLSRDAKEDFEGKIIENTLGVPAVTLPGWLMRGAVREDDSGNLIATINSEPGDDPYGNFNRWCNHFFDPTKSAYRAATFLGCPIVYEDAANWAIGTSGNGAFASPVVANPSRRNHFTAMDAREALYRAVTGKKQDGTPVGTGDADADFKTRKTYYATMFRALGDVMHLNQDMAQPQHTRNESHAGITSFNIGGNPAYERRIDARARGAGVSGPDGQPIFPGPLVYGTYDAPRFGRLSDYWSTAPGQSIPMGRGLADYSNRGFFTPANNYGASNYASPPSDPTKYTPESRTIVAGQSSVTVTYLRGTVTDTQTNGGASVLLTKESVWKNLVTGATQLPTYTLDNTIFDDIASVLVPRAVGYSAGILDYFFRGKMQIGPPDGGVYAVLDHSKVSLDAGELQTNFKGFDKIKIKLSAPDTGNDGQPQAFGGGKLLAVVKFRRNLCFDNDLTKFADLDQPDADGKSKYESCRTQAEEIVVSDPVNNGQPFTPTSQAQSLTLNFSKQIPLNATDMRLQVIYRGKLGSEDDEVVVATQDISEPTFFSYTNASDYWTLDMGADGVKVFTRNDINASQDLLARVVPSSCVDKTVSPWQLKSSCLQPFDVRIGLRVGTFQIDVQAVPVRRLIRIAFLGDAGARVDFAQIPENTCYPHDPFNVGTVKWQSNADANNDPTVTYPTFQKVRGTWAWYPTSCVGNADGKTPGTPDNRDDPGVMTDLIIPNRVPVDVTITDTEQQPQ